MGTGGAPAVIVVRARALLRGAVGASIALAILAGIAGGVSLGAWAAARRASSSFDRFLAFAEQPPARFLLPAGADDQRAVAQVRALPEVAAASRTTDLPARFEVDGRVFDGGMSVMIDAEMATPEGRPVLVDGRLTDPDSATEILLPEPAARLVDVGVGDVVRFTPLRLSEPPEPIDDLAQAPTIVGVTRSPSDLTASVGVVEQDPNSPVLGPGWWAEYGGRVDVWGIGLLVRGRAGVGLAELRTAVEAVLPPETGFEGATPAEQTSVADAIGYESAAIAIFALLVGLAAVVLIGQALARQGSREAADTATLQAMGASRGQLLGAAGLRALPVALASAVVAGGIVIVSSAWTPFGLAHGAEIAHGWRLDVTVVVVGGLVVALAVLCFLAAPAWVLARRPRSRPAAVGVAGRAAAVIGLGPQAVAGAGLLLPARRAAGVSARAVLVGLAAAVTVAIAAAGLAASLRALVDEPERYGVTWDLEVNTFGVDQFATLEPLLSAHPDVAAAAIRSGAAGTVDGLATQVVAYTDVKGDGLDRWASVVAGQQPERAGEVALGRQTMERLGVAIGDDVMLALEGDDGGPQPLRVVGRAVINLGASADAGWGAVVPAAWPPLARAGFDQMALVRLQPGADPSPLTAALQEAGVVASAPVRQPAVRNVERIRSLPWLLLLVVTMFALATLLHALLTTQRRQRSQLAVLRTLGFTRRQVRSTMVWGSGLVAAAALAVGIPAGIVLGRWLWRVIADGLGVVAAPVVPVAVVPIAVVASLVVVSTIAAGLAIGASRRSPALDLRVE